MLFLSGKDPHTIATAIAGVLGHSWSVRVGSAPEGVEVGGEGPSSITVVSEDEDLARDLSARVGARVVFVQSWRAAFGGQLVVFDNGVRIRGISTGEDGTTSDGTPFPFEADVFDTEDGDDYLTIDANTVEDYCENLGLRICPQAAISYSVVSRPARANQPAQAARPSRAKRRAPANRVAGAKRPSKPKVPAKRVAQAKQSGHVKGPARTARPARVKAKPTRRVSRATRKK